MFVVESFPAVSSCLLLCCTPVVFGFFFILPDGYYLECAAGQHVQRGLIVRPAKSCACRHQCMPRLLKARPARRGCLYQTAFCLAFVVWVLVCSSSLGRHSQTSPPPPPVLPSVLVLPAEPEPQGEMPLPIPERCPCPSLCHLG